MSRPTAFVQSPAVVQPPEMALFMGADPPYDPGRAADESDGLRATLEGLGVGTLAPADALAGAPHDALVDLAVAATTVDDGERRVAARAAIERWSASDLVPIVLRQPRLVLEADPALGAISPDQEYESYVLRPLFGLMFPRDHYLDLGDAVAVGRLRRQDRSRETAVVHVVLEHVLGRPPDVAVPAPLHLEGGDFVAYGDVAVLNVGFRTDPGTVEVLRPFLEARFRHVLVVRDRLRRPGQFHLDHWLALGPGVALVAADRLDDTSAVTARTLAGGAAGAPGGEGGTTLRRALAEVGVGVADLAPEAEAAFAANVFFVPERAAAVVSTRCAPFVDGPLAKCGVETVAVPFDEHHKQFGSIHCAVNTVPRPAGGAG